MNKFKVGDFIRRIHNNIFVTKGRIYEVISCNLNAVRIKDDLNNINDFWAPSFELVESKDETPTISALTGDVVASTRYNFTVQMDMNKELAALNPECTHTPKLYEGLLERYHYCTKCNKKLD